jgi:hypothetical protein
MTDDLLPMMTLGCGDARLDRVPSGQIIASPREDAAPAVIAAHVNPLAGTGLRLRRPGMARDEHGQQNYERQRPIDGHVALCVPSCR